jgi:hypothetical protein
MSQSIEQIDISLNIPQLEVKLVNANETWCLWGRGTGKTTGPLADFMATRAEAMPGHTGGVFGMSFTQLENKVIPKLMQGLADQGYDEGTHYVYDKKPPQDFDSPITPVVSYKRHFFWYTGAVFPLVSLHEKGSANAYDFQSGIFDEVKFMSKKQLDDEIFPTFRGSIRHKKLFSHKCEWLSKIFATDKMADPLVIQWILDKRALCNKQMIEAVIASQTLANDLQLQLVHAMTQKQRVHIEKQIQEINFYLNDRRKRLVYVSEASALENIDVLGEAWLHDKERNMSSIELKVAIKNEDPEKVTGGFYPDLEESVHVYEAMNQEDYNTAIPLLLGADYQHSMTPFLFAQISQLPWEDRPTLNIIDELAMIAPKGLEDACDRAVLMFPDRRSVMYLTDHNAIGVRQSGAPYNEIVKNRLTKHSWHPTEIYTGQAPDHYLKYERIKYYLTNKASQPLRIRINKKSTHLLKSLGNAKATIDSRGRTKKDKRFEDTSRFPEVDQRNTTHFSDVFDLIVWGVNELQVVKLTSSGSGVSFR